MSDPTIMDDLHPSLRYSSGWKHDGDAEKDESFSHTGTSGRNVTVPFVGSRIIVYGTEETFGKRPRSSYRIDNGSISYHIGTVQAKARYGVEFFDSGRISYGNHTLLITTLVNEGQFLLDYFEVYDEIPMLEPETSGGPPGSNASPTDSVQSASRSGGGAQVSVWALVGTILGFLAIVLSISTLFLIRRQRRRKQRDSRPFPALQLSSNFGEMKKGYIPPQVISPPLSTRLSLDPTVTTDAPLPYVEDKKLEPVRRTQPPNYRP